MTEEQLDKLVNEFYESVELSDSKIQDILANTPPKDVVVPFYRRTWFSYAAAACIALMVVSVVVNKVASRVGYSDQVDVANQVVDIYDRHLAPDVYSNDLKSIAAGLSHSDFSIIPTNMDALGKYQVLGGRNCGINGLKAVHVMLMNQDSQKECCLYVLPDVESFKRFKDSMVDVGDHQVSLWHDKGRLFVLYDPSR